MKTPKDFQTFLENNEDMTIEVGGGVSYNLRDVIEESYRLYNAKFENGETEDSGFTRIFYRMIWVIYRTIIMASDIDLKDLNIRSLNGRGIRVLSLFKMAVHTHLGRTFFGKYVDKVLGDVCWFGSSMTKRVDGKVETVDLRNYTTNATIKDPQERDHAEACYYSWEKMQSYKDDWKGAWEDIEALWKKMQEEGETKFRIFEWWTQDTLEEKLTDVHKVCIKYLDNEIVDWKKNEKPNDWQPKVELDRFKTPYKRKRQSKRMSIKLGDVEEMYPYEQADFFDAPGRWLAFGCAELLSGLSEHYNEYTNNKRKKDILDLKGIFVHKAGEKSNSLTQEYISNLDTHAVISLAQDEDFQRLVVDTKTAEYIANVDKLYELMRLTLGVTAQGTGEEMPASTSATQASINAQTQQTTYDFVRERMHHFIVGLFQNGYFEDILNELDEQEFNAIIGDPRQLVEVDNFLVDNAMNKWASDMKEATGMYPTEEKYGQVREQVMAQLAKMDDMRFPDLKKEMLKGVDSFIEFYVTNESFDKKSKVETLVGIKNDPNSTKNKEAVEDTILDLLNENPRQYDKTPEQKAMEAEAMRQNMMQQMLKTQNDAQAMNAPIPAI